MKTFKAQLRELKVEFDLKIQSIESQLKWINDDLRTLNNPPKYIRGYKFGDDLMICGTMEYSKKIINNGMFMTDWFYQVVNLKTGELLNMFQSDINEDH